MSNLPVHSKAESGEQWHLVDFHTDSHRAFSRSLFERTIYVPGASPFDLVLIRPGVYIGRLGDKPRAISTHNELRFWSRTLAAPSLQIHSSTQAY